MKDHLLTKYAVPVPRYTSYPPANFFNESFTDKAYYDAVIASNKQEPDHISIYIHIPFCFQMCYYCGCNAVLLKDKSLVKTYLEALKKEIRMILPLLSKERKISQIHYGGGTPTSQPVCVLKELNELILSEFDCIDNPEIAIECHPGYMDEDYWNALPELGFNRVSIGVQDLNEAVLHAVHRKKSQLPISEIVSLLKINNIAFNLDFIYGLPLQTTGLFTQTIRQAIDMQPDRIVTFSYAHVPWVNPLQQKLENQGLPDAAEKNRIFQTASQLLKGAGYQPIGLDHFVLPDDELYIASQEKKLHRNFQGYCTRRTTGQVYALGATGISQLAGSYSQNVKDIPAYIKLINEGRLPVLKGYALNKEELITREVISTLMCNYMINWNEMASALCLSVAEVKQALNYNEQVLTELADDKIIEFDEQFIHILPEATPFVRNVAASLDKLMRGSDKKYSKAI